MIPCNQINNEAARLKAAFTRCATLSASDLDAMVDLILSIQTCTAGLNQDNIFKVINVTYDIPTQSVASVINALPQFAVSDKEIILILAKETNVGAGNTAGTDKTFVVRGKGKGIYGSGYTQFLLNEFVLLYEGAAGINLALFADTPTSNSAVIPSTNVIQLNPATSTTFGVMSPADKTKLDGINPQSQADWTQANTSAVDFIKNKPTALSQFTDDINAINVQSDWTQANASAFDFIKNKPTLAPGDAQKNVQSDWNQTNNTLDDFIKNKPVIPTTLSQLTDDINATNIQPDWNQTNNTLFDFIKNKPTIPSGTDLSTVYNATSIIVVSSTGAGTGVLLSATSTNAGLLSSADKIKLDGLNANAEQNVQADWNETNTGSDAFILNKPGFNPGTLIGDTMYWTGTLWAPVKYQEDFFLGIVNTMFTLSQTPLINLKLSVFRNGSLQRRGAGMDYDFSGNTLTLTKTTDVNDLIKVEYQYT